MCTDTPGEFSWLAGPLLQSVQAGHWILLEDIDLAPMDVVSVLIPLLESRTLSVPAHGNAVKASPGFQLFATQRYIIYCTMMCVRFVVLAYYNTIHLGDK